MELIVLSSSSSANEQTISCNLIVHQIGEHENVLLDTKKVEFSKEQKVIVVSAVVTSSGPPNSCSEAEAELNVGLQIFNCFSVDGEKVTDFLVEPQSIVFHPSFYSASELYRLWLLGMLPIMEISLHKKHRQWLSTQSLVAVAQGMHSTHNFSGPIWGAGPSSVMTPPLPLTPKEHVQREGDQPISPWNATEQHIHWIWQMLVVLGGILLVVTWIRRQWRLRQLKQGKLRQLAPVKPKRKNNGSDTDDDMSSCSSGTSHSRKATISSFFGVHSRDDYFLSDPRPRLPSLRLPFARYTSLTNPSSSVTSSNEFTYSISHSYCYYQGTGRAPVW